MCRLQLLPDRTASFVDRYFIQNIVNMFLLFLLLPLPLPVLLSLHLLSLLFHLLVVLRLVPLPNTQISSPTHSACRNPETDLSPRRPATPPAPNHYFRPGTQRPPSRHLRAMMAFRRSDGQPNHIATRTWMTCRKC